MQTAHTDISTEKFWDRIAPKYARQPISHQEAYEEKLARLRSLLSPSDHVLEVGCGTGSTALRLAPHLTHITGTDVSSGMVEIAQSKLGAAAPANVSFIRAAASDVVASHPFDAICAFSLLHLVGDIPKVLASVHAQLKPGGLFISKTECLKHRPALMRALVPILTAFGGAPRVYALSTDDLHRYLAAAGFEIEQTLFFGGKRSNPFIVARKRPTAG